MSTALVSGERNSPACLSYVVLCIIRYLMELGMTQFLFPPGNISATCSSLIFMVFGS